jgi:hypothetical protein
MCSVFMGAKMPSNPPRAAGLVWKRDKWIVIRKKCPVNLTGNSSIGGSSMPTCLCHAPKGRHALTAEHVHQRRPECFRSIAVQYQLCNESTITCTDNKMVRIGKNHCSPVGRRQQNQEASALSSPPQSTYWRIGVLSASCATSSSVSTFLWMLVTVV